ncbi:bifunctional hydroxymethylpyrimidine kinase/phosphomethylpyrimidine kinase [Fictibacillus sp. KIGAM418]|uniref:Hydroxymethylpyrimidine/phosphomethylpyrimidine kinase n=1 Tax=Fictibacillus marinisediminis TaxID=2878389 RepID=A0A9X1X9M6_9BACL|nr:bifunctional hydroxymethylpyrimidine kinase/phosphomethylpyrimidine kinase [Fictibacillus marinisediminis]MCK6256581.1 bifunctional hydroxymethylpyrimidine kinase/phosphomethylpyrimidine kinase [Fictibacillus marinisediminis]
MLKTPKALTVAGSDSGGGAGIQADLKTFQELGAYGMSVITAVTAQNTLGVQGIHPVPVEMILKQLNSIEEDLRPEALKTGMLFSAEIIEAVSRHIRKYEWKNVVVDPVMIAKGGADLLRRDAVEALKKQLIPLASILTPNIPEAEQLTGRSISTKQDREDAAKFLHDLGAGMIVIKGGHLSHDKAPVDLFYDGEQMHELEGRRIDTPQTHGTGCTFAAAIAAELALGKTPIHAVKTAKTFIQEAISHPLHIGSGHGPTNHWAYRRNQA